MIKPDTPNPLPHSLLIPYQRARFELSESIPCAMTREFVLTNLVANIGGDTKLKWKVNIEALRAGAHCHCRDFASNRY